jgi:hypothetical protein
MKAINDLSKKLGPSDASDIEDISNKVLDNQNAVPRNKIREALKLHLPRLP